MKKATLILALSLLSALTASADSTPTPGSPAPGQFFCQLTYDLFDPSAPAQQPPPPGCPTCTMVDPQHSMVTPPELKLQSGFKYIYMGAKTANVSASDSLLTLSGGAQINADGYNTGSLSISQGKTSLVSVMAPVVSSNVEVKIPGPQGMKYQGKIVQQIDATCWIQ